MTSETGQSGRAWRARHALARPGTGGRVKSASDFMNLALDTRVGLMEEMTPRECAQLFHDWAFWARPDQAPPDGDWVIWLILAGRGAGKTRAGAEAVRTWVEMGLQRGATALQARLDDAPGLRERPPRR